MNHLPEGNAIVYCENAFDTPNGKTAHGLVRYTKRYRILSVVDSKLAGKDSGLFLDGKRNNIPIVHDLKAAFEISQIKEFPIIHFVIGLAPEGGALSSQVRSDVIEAIKLGLNIDSGLHDFLSEDKEISDLALKHNVQIRDVRKPPHKKQLHFFSGKIEQVDSLKIALLGTDSAVGKRTTAIILALALEKAGHTTEFTGTGQTAWIQGAKYGIVLDSLINDFVSGEIEHAVWSAWNDRHPDAIIIEGQGSLMNPAFPGGFEICAAGRPDIIILQHAPGRKDYDGFPGYAIHSIEKQIEAIELIAEKPVVAITINHENLSQEETKRLCRSIEKKTGRVTLDLFYDDIERLISALKV